MGIGEQMCNLKFWGIIFLFTCLSTGCTHTAPNFCRSESPDCIDRIVGTYLGEAFSVGGLQPTLTSFFINKDGKIVGKYFISYKEYKSKKVYYSEGDLFDFNPLGEYVAWTTWHDEYGKGNLRLVFRFNGKEFAGYWGHSKGDHSAPWYGRKVTNVPTLTSEDIEKLLATISFMGEPDPQWPNQFLY